MAKEKEVKDEVIESAKPKDDVVQVSRSQLNEILEKLNRLEEEQSGKKPISLNDIVSERKVKLRLIGEDFVLALKKDKLGNVEFLDQKNEYGNPDMIVTATLLKPDGGTEEKKIFYLMDLLNGSQVVEVKVVDSRQEPVIKRYGTVERQSVPDGAWDFKGSGVEVYLEDKSWKIWSTVELPDGRKVEISNDFVNM